MHKISIIYPFTFGKIDYKTTYFTPTIKQHFPPLIVYNKKVDDQEKM